MECSGNENLLSVLGMIALRKDLLERITLFGQKLLVERVFPFLLFKGNKKVTVLVDNHIQCEKVESADVQIHSHCRNKNVFWVSLFGKAYRKLFKEGSLHETCHRVLGVFPEVIRISNKAILKDNFLQVLKFHLRNGGLLGALKKG